MIDVPIYLKECTKIKKVQKDAMILQVLCNYRFFRIRK